MELAETGPQFMRDVIYSDNVLENFLGFYESFKVTETTWLMNNTTPYITVCTYLAVIFSLQRYMRDRKEVHLYGIPFLHNSFLALGSFVMAAFITFELAIILWNDGFQSLCCDPHSKYTSGRLYFWYYVFYLSKFYELLDTVFLVLKKRELEFLHVYHHFITLLLVYITTTHQLSIQWVAILANCSVHVMMYSYYALCTLGHRPWWKKYITTGQILQFVTDVGMNFTWNFFGGELFPRPGAEGSCGGTWQSYWFGQYVLSSYLVLFIQLYRQTYVKRTRTGVVARTNSVESRTKSA